MVKSLSTEARMMSVAGDWRDEGDGVEVRHLGTRDICLTRLGPAAAPLTAVVVAGLKGLSSSEHNTNIALYSRVKKIEDRKGERVKESPQET